MNFDELKRWLFLGREGTGEDNVRGGGGFLRKARGKE
jgi:hypothetical protein